eukprot:TRINITY_DN3127_c1_g1_i1.p1 TRINITY_DN3127_c1_g1~~TRINITY_DN3127_c1_g1_i1.p1  ORF type:complete len:354 (+),score=50.75 TRINITY_DN3127_c1_g1_i1:193-1254(+)
MHCILRSVRELDRKRCFRRLFLSGFSTNLGPEHQSEVFRSRSYRWNPSLIKSVLIEVGKNLGYKIPEDWYQIDKEKLIKAHPLGKSLLRHFKNSPARAVVDVFQNGAEDDPLFNHRWQLHRFKSNKPLDAKQTTNGTPDLSYWTPLRVREFVADWMREAVGFDPEKNPEWLQQTLPELLQFLPTKVDLLKRRGGYDLLKAHSGSLFSVMSRAFPEKKWREFDFELERVSPPHRKIWKILTKRMIVENDEETPEIFLNFRHPDLIHRRVESPSKVMELDIWIPKFRLALEYQGEQHYHQLREGEDLEQQQKRDDEKMSACSENNERVSPPHRTIWKIIKKRMFVDNDEEKLEIF